MDGAPGALQGSGAPAKRVAARQRGGAVRRRVGAHVREPARRLLAHPAPGRARRLLPHPPVHHSARLRPRRVLPVDARGRRRRLDPRRAHPDAVPLLEEDARTPSRHLGQSRAPRVRRHRHADGGRVPRPVALGAVQVSRVPPSRGVVRRGRRAAFLRAAPHPDDRAARVDARAAQHLLDGRRSGRGDRADGDARRVPGVCAGAAPRDAAVHIARRVAVLRSAPVRADVLGARRALGLRRGGAAGELILPPPQTAPVGHREYRATPHPPPASPDPQLSPPAGAGRPCRAAPGPDADALGKLAMRPPHPVGRAGAKAGTVRGGERGGDLPLPRPAQPRSAANTPITAITIPSAIFAAAAAARPATAPHPARTAVPVVRDSEYSNSAAPANDPRNAPITLPTIGTGTPSTAPTIPPTRAPHADRRDPPNVRVSRNPSHHSTISPRKARPNTAPMVATPTERKSVSQP